MSAQRRTSTRTSRSPVVWAIVLALVLALGGVAWFQLRPRGHAQPATAAPHARAAAAPRAGHRAHSGPTLESLHATRATRPAAALASRHVRVCGNKALLGAGPTAPPAGAFRVRAGNNSHLNFGRAYGTDSLAT